MLGPSIAYHGTRSDPNNSSLILRVRVAGHTILMTGDAEIATEQAMLRAGIDLHADILKVAHHGSAYFDPRFIAAVTPQVAIISDGAGNDYGHPAPSLLHALAAVGAAVVRTDLLGDVALTATGPDHDLHVASHHTGVRTTVSSGGNGALGPPVGSLSRAPPGRSTVAALAASSSRVRATMTVCPTMCPIVCPTTSPPRSGSSPATRNS